MLPCLGLTVGICYWQICHSALVYTGSPWRVEVQAVEPVHNAYRCPMTTLCLGPLGNDSNVWSQRLTVPSLGHSSSAKVTFDKHLHATQVSSHLSDIWRDLSTYFFPRWFFHHFQSYTLQVPDHVASPLATGHESVTISVDFYIRGKNVWSCVLP